MAEGKPSRFSLDPSPKKQRYEVATGDERPSPARPTTVSPTVQQWQSAGAAGAGREPQEAGGSNEAALAGGEVTVTGGWRGGGGGGGGGYQNAPYNCCSAFRTDFAVLSLLLFPIHACRCRQGF
jgi:hypothetical protein